MYVCEGMTHCAVSLSAGYVTISSSKISTTSQTQTNNATQQQTHSTPQDDGYCGHTEQCSMWRV